MACRASSCGNLQETTERGDDRAPGQLDLETIARQRLGVGQFGLGGGAEIGLGRPRAAKGRFGGTGWPWLMSNAAQRQSDVADRAIVAKSQRRRNRNKSKGIAGPVANLAIGRAPSKGIWRQLDGYDQLVSAELGLDPGGLAGRDDARW